MNGELLQSLIYDDFGYVKEGRNWGRSERHSSLVVNEEEQKWYWNSEGMGGGPLEYLIKVRKLTKDKAKEILNLRERIVTYAGEEEVISENPQEILVDLLWKMGKGNREYWYKRCFTDNTIDSNRLGFYDGWSLIPLYRSGRFVNFQCRRDEPSKFIKYWYDIHGFEPVLINSEILELVDLIYITEGPTDSILLNQFGIPSVAHTGGSGYFNPGWIPLFNRVKSIYYIQDNDSAGVWGSMRVSDNLGLGRVRIFKFDNDKEGYDTGNYFQDGGTPDELRKMVESESKYSFEIGEIDEIKSRRKRRH